MCTSRAPPGVAVVGRVFRGGPPCYVHSLESGGTPVDVVHPRVRNMCCVPRRVEGRCSRVMVVEAVVIDCTKYVLSRRGRLQPLCFPPPLVQTFAAIGARKPLLEPVFVRVLGCVNRTISSPLLCFLSWYQCVCLRRGGRRRSFCPLCSMFILSCALQFVCAHVYFVLRIAICRSDI